MYSTKRPVKSVASETQQNLDKAMTEIYKLKNQLSDLKKSSALYSSASTTAYQNDRILNNLSGLIGKIEKDKVNMKAKQDKLTLDLRTLSNEIESYESQLRELDIKERNILKSLSDGAEARKERKDMQMANNALKSEIHKKLVQREKDRYELQSKVDKVKLELDEKNENLLDY